MSGKKRFDSENITAALKLLRALPIKDGRKSIQETLRLLEQGMCDAQEKGYNQREMRDKLTAAGVIVSATTLKDFLAGKKERACQRQDGGKVTKPDSPGQRQREEIEKTVSSGGIIIKPDTPRDEL